MTRLGVFPGSFNPLTTGHVVIAESAVAQCRLDRLDLVVSRVALGKEDVVRPLVVDRLHVLEDAVASRPYLGAVMTDMQLLADIAEGYDVLVVGTDKWHQLHDLAFYGGSTSGRDAALARLPDVVVVPRPPHPDPDGVLVLEVPPHVSAMSSTRARQGEPELMAREARAFDLATGAWSDPARYERWVGDRSS